MLTNSIYVSSQLFRVVNVTRVKLLSVNQNDPSRPKVKPKLNIYNQIRATFTL